MSEVLRPARPVAPGRILKQELEALGWSQKDLAAILGRPEQMVSEIANGTKQITPETALELAQALDTSPELWMNLEANYRLQMAQRQSRDDAIARRSLLYAALPLRAMARRGWLTLREVTPGTGAGGNGSARGACGIRACPASAFALVQRT
ncbi:MAG: HigA family addiction module antitoxin [Anaerolineae bacterium]